MRAFLLAASLLATQASAQDWTIRDTDQLLPPEALTSALSGQTLVFFDDGRSVYNGDGTYNYTYGGGGTWYGHWRVEGDSLVCVTFVTEVTRCDLVVQNGDRLVVLTADGQRFPIRDVEPAPEVAPNPDATL